MSSHAVFRAAERHGLDLTRSDLDAWVRRLRRGHPDAVRLQRRAGWTHLAAIRIGGRWYPVIYDEMRDRVVTFLPAEVLDGRRGFLNRIAARAKKAGVAR